MRCPEVSPLVPRFFDGELEGRQMRSVALHVTRCADCEQELRELEGLQALVSSQVSAAVDAIDMSRIWVGVGARIDQAPLSWSERLITWWEGLEAPRLGGMWPALAGAAAVAVLAVGVWTYPGAESAPAPLAERQTAAEFQTAELGKFEAEEAQLADERDNSAVFESIVGSVREHMVEPETGPTVLWVSDSGDLR